MAYTRCIDMYNVTNSVIVQVTSLVSEQ